MSGGIPKEIAEEMPHEISGETFKSGIFLRTAQEILLTVFLGRRIYFFKGCKFYADIRRFF